MSKSKSKMEVSRSGSQSAESSDQAHLSDTFTSRDYEIILDVLYGLFSRESAEKVRVFDPFVADARQAPLITPRMLTERLEAMLGECASA